MMVVKGGPRVLRGLGSVALVAALGWLAPALLWIGAPILAMCSLGAHPSASRNEEREQLVALLSERTDAVLALLAGPGPLSVDWVAHRLSRTLLRGETLVPLGTQVAVLLDKPGGDAELARRACQWQAALSGPHGIIRIGAVRIHDQLWPEDHVAHAEAALASAGSDTETALVLDLDRPRPSVAGPKRRRGPTLTRFARPVLNADSRALCALEPVCGLSANPTSQERLRLILDQIEAGAALLTSIGMEGVGLSIRVHRDVHIDSGLADAVAFTLDAADLPPDLVTLHLDLGTSPEAIDRLESLGCRLSVAANEPDRIGAHDVWLPLELTLSISQNPVRHAAVSAIVAQAKARGRHVFAPDIANPADAALLADIGCGTLSGPGVAPVTEGNALAAWLGRRELVKRAG